MPDYVDAYGWGLGGSSRPQTPYQAPTYKTETKVYKPAKCGACGSTAVKHTDKQCAANQKRKELS